MRQEGYLRVGSLEDFAAALERMHQQQHQQQQQEEELVLEHQEQDTTAAVAAGADLQGGQEGGRRGHGQGQGQGRKHGGSKARRQLAREEAVAAGLGLISVLMPRGDVYYRPAPVAQVRTTHAFTLPGFGCVWLNVMSRVQC